MDWSTGGDSRSGSYRQPAAAPATAAATAMVTVPTIATEAKQHKRAPDREQGTRSAAAPKAVAGAGATAPER